MPIPEGADTDALTRDVRVLIADTDPARQVLDDHTILDFLGIANGNAKRAAAEALEAIAVSETLVGKVIRTQDLQTDGTKVADALLKRADRLRDQAMREDAEADDFAFDVVYPDYRRRPEGTEHRHEVWGL